MRRRLKPNEMPCTYCWNSGYYRFKRGHYWYSAVCRRHNNKQLRLFAN